jgi:cytoskeletal protein CcmA (bactofilin family)
MKKLILICFFSVQIIANAQLKVGNNPKTISSNTYFDLESTKGNRFVISKDSAKVGIGTTIPTNRLHIKDTISNNPIRIEGLLSGNTVSDSVLMINALGVVRRNSASYLASTNEPWFSKTTAKGALLNTDTIYHLGMVGIGTNSPSVGLHIRKSTMIEGADGSKYPLTINLGEDGIAYGNLAENRGMKFTTRSSATSNTFLSSINSGMLSTGGTATDRYMSFNVKSDTNIVMFLTSTNGGMVGLGTTNPTSRLHIKDSVNFNPLRLEGLVSGSATTDSVLAINSAGAVRRISSSALALANEPWFNAATNKGATANNQNIYQLGKVGIGVSNPFYKLQVTDSTTTTIGASNPVASFIVNASSNNAISITSNLAGSTLVGINGGAANGELLSNSRYLASPANGANIQLIDGASTTPKALLTATSVGVGIGTVTPTSKLHVKDTINNNPVKIEGLLSGNTITDSVLLINSNGIVKRNSTEALAATYEPWFNVATNAGATSNTQNIYQMGNVGIGTNDPKSIFNIESTSGTILNTRFITMNSVGANLVLQKSANATTGSNTAVPSGDVIGRIVWKSNNGTGYNANSGAEIRSDQVGLSSTSNNGSKLAFSTTKINTIVPVERMTIVDSGYVGIGTTTPGEALDVRGNVRIGNTDTSNYIAFRGLTADGPGIYDHTYIGERIYAKPESSELLLFKGNDTGAVSSTVGPDRIRLLAAEHRFDTYSAATNGLFESVANSSNNTNRMVIKNDGKIGIGTTTPNGAFTLYGASSLSLPATIQGIANATKEIVFGRGGATTGVAAITAIDNGSFGGGLSFITKSSNATNNFPTSGIQSMVIDWNGRVGIGTGNPNWLLDVQTNSNSSIQTAQFVNTNSGTSAEAQIGIGAGPGAWAKLVGYNGTLGIRNYTTGTELMTIKTSGNIGVGTTSPSFPMHILSSNNTSLMVETTSGDPNGAIIVKVPSVNTVCGASQMNCSEFIMFQVGGSNVGNITPNSSGTATVYNTTSDLRLKENILKTQFSIADLMKMNVVDYNYKMDKNKNKEIGFVAQELYKIIPSVVKQGSDELNENGTPKNPWMVDYSKLTPIVVKAAQDLKKENEEQQAIINKQSQKIEELMKRLEALEAKLK